jgi:hypothetical protein
MRQLWSIFVCLVLVLGLGLSEAPRPCHGDGHGGACQAAGCQCDGTCTCKLAHEHERLVEEAEAAAECRDGSSNPHIREARLALERCHGPGAGPKFALPLPQFLAALPGTAPAWHEATGFRPYRPAAERPAARPQAPPLKPPTLLA